MQKPATGDTRDGVLVNTFLFALTCTYPGLVVFLLALVTGPLPDVLERIGNFKRSVLKLLDDLYGHCADKPLPVWLGCCTFVAFARPLVWLVWLCAEAYGVVVGLIVLLLLRVVGMPVVWLLRHLADAWTQWVWPWPLFVVMLIRMRWHQWRGHTSALTMSIQWRSHVLYWRRFGTDPAEEALAQTKPARRCDGHWCIYVLTRDGRLAYCPRCGGMRRPQVRGERPTSEFWCPACRRPSLAATMCAHGGYVGQGACSRIVCMDCAIPDPDAGLDFQGKPDGYLCPQHFHYRAMSGATRVATPRPAPRRQRLAAPADVLPMTVVLRDPTTEQEA